MILLPNGCKCSDPIVNPKNWKTCGIRSLNKPWRITYRYYDPNYPNKPEWGKLIARKGMNEFNSLDERREATRILLEEEIYDLKVLGFNPISKSYNGPDIEFAYEIEPTTLLPQAMQYAFTKLDLERKTLADISSIMKYFIQSANYLKFQNIRISDLKRKHVRAILENLCHSRNYSNDRYNKVRAYLQMLFKKLLEWDVIEYNPITGISKKKTVKKIRMAPTDQELELIKEHLKNNYYTFYRYMEIFFHSGCRSSELMRIQFKDVYIDKQLFKVTVKKGRSYVEEWRAINDNVVYLWKELESDSIGSDYVFSKGLKPGPVRIDEWQISKRWREHVKLKLGIKADFYSLKHVHTTKIIEHYGRLLASNVNGHKSTKMNDQHYDLLKGKRMLDQAKTIDLNL